MPDLLTHEEYQAIGKSLDFPTNAFINGQFQASKSGNTFETINPATVSYTHLTLPTKRIV